MDGVNILYWWHISLSVKKCGAVCSSGCEVVSWGNAAQAAGENTPRGAQLNDEMAKSNNGKVTGLVRGERTRFYIESEILCAASPFFEAALKGALE